MDDKLLETLKSILPESFGPTFVWIECSLSNILWFEKFSEEFVRIPYDLYPLFYSPDELKDIHKYETNNLCSYRFTNLDDGEIIKTPRTVIAFPDCNVLDFVISKTNSYLDDEIKNIESKISSSDVPFEIKRADEITLYIARTEEDTLVFELTEYEMSRFEESIKLIEGYLKENESYKEEWWYEDLFESVEYTTSIKEMSIIFRYHLFEIK